MLFKTKLDVLENDIAKYDKRLLDLLLIDKTTKRNIVWATDDYSYMGEEYQPDCEMLPELVTGENYLLVQPRVAKSMEEQENRTRDKAEVFTPCWVCNAQNNLVDEEWFGYSGVFNTEIEEGWSVNRSKIVFSESGQKTWKKYVDAKRLEVSCGEAPYLVSRYDSVTGEIIPITERIGLLDRKLRVVGENTANKDDWFKWALRAFQSVYGYEYQGDSLLLARENLLATFIEYYCDRFDEDPSLKQLMQIANVISWNIWQMDGIKYVVPGSCKPLITEELTLFGPRYYESPCPGCNKGLYDKHTGIYCKVFDWREKASLTFTSMLKGRI
ncbi:MAG TPA: restriction endonuclease subunit M [Eubacterium sp.]|nr:restriction endonuclease subunit M [Eubacterium sp.]